MALRLGRWTLEHDALELRQRHFFVAIYVLKTKKRFSS